MGLLNLKNLIGIAYFAIFLTSFGLDQSTKLHAQKDLLVWEHESEIHNYQGKLIPLWSIGDKREGNYLGLNLHYARNTGSAWSLGENIDEAYRLPFFHTVTGACILFILWMLINTPITHYAARLAYVMVIGGAIGNFVDRARIGYVIDWIDVDWRIMGWFYDYPVFNVADMAIVGGLIILTYDMFILEKRRIALETTQKDQQIEQKS